MQLPIDTGAEFASSIHKLAIEKCNLSPQDTLEPEHFLFDMFSTQRNDILLWWMSDLHPVASMILYTYAETGGHAAYRPFSRTVTVGGNCVSFTHEQVMGCVEDIITLCRQYQEQPQSPLPPVAIAMRTEEGGKRE
jgi:hypothetical protein